MVLIYGGRTQWSLSDGKRPSSMACSLHLGAPIAGRTPMVTCATLRDAAPARPEPTTTSAAAVLSELDVGFLDEVIAPHPGVSYRREPSGWNVMTHIVSAAFALLQRRYRDEEGDEGWSSFSNLLALSHVLEQHGLPHWSDENFQPERAATCLYPHRITEGV